jgi:hypothetical protein
VYPHLLAWEGIREITNRSHSACLCKILQIASIASLA